MGRADRTLAYFSLSDFFGLLCAFVASLPNRMSNNQILALVVVAFVTYIYYDVEFAKQRRHIERKEDKADETRQKVDNLINNENKPTVADPVLASILEAVNKLTAQVEATSQKVDIIEAQSKAPTADTFTTSALSGLDCKLGLMDSKVEIIQRDIATLKKKDDKLPVEDTKISEVFQAVHQLGENVASISQDVYCLKEKVDKPPVEDKDVSAVFDIVRSLEEKVSTVSQEVVTLKGMNNTPAIESLIVTHLDELKSKLGRDLHFSFEKVNGRIDAAEGKVLDQDAHISAISDSVCKFEEKLDTASNTAIANANSIRNMLDKVSNGVANDFAEVNKNLGILTQKAFDDEKDASLFKEAFGMLYEKVETTNKDIVTLLAKEVAPQMAVHEQIAEVDRNVHGPNKDIEDLKREMNSVLKELEDEEAKVTAAEQHRQATEKKLADMKAEMNDSLIKEMKKNDAAHKAMEKAGIDVHLYTMPAMRPDRARETVYYTTLEPTSEEQDTELYDMPTRPSSEGSDTGSGDFDDFVTDPEAYDEDVLEVLAEVSTTEDVGFKAVNPIMAELWKNADSFVQQSFAPATHPKHETNINSQGEENHIAAILDGVRKSAEPTALVVSQADPAIPAISTDNDEKRTKSPAKLIAATDNTRNSQEIVKIGTPQSSTPVPQPAGENKSLTMMSALTAGLDTQKARDVFVDRHCDVCEIPVQIDLIDGIEDWATHNREQHIKTKCGTKLINKYDVGIHEEGCDMNACKEVRKRKNRGRNQHMVQDTQTVAGLAPQQTTRQQPPSAIAVPKARERMKQSAPENKEGVKACRNCGDWWPTKGYEAFKAHYSTCGKTICRNCDLVVSKQYIQAHFMDCRQRTQDEREAYAAGNFDLPSIAHVPETPTQPTNTIQSAYITTPVTNTPTPQEKIAKATMPVSNGGLGGPRWSTPILTGSTDAPGVETPRNTPTASMSTHAFARNQAPRSNDNPGRGRNNQVSSNGGPRPPISPSASSQGGPRPPISSFKGNGYRPAPSGDVPQFTGNKIFYQDPKYEGPSAENKKE